MRPQFLLFSAAGLLSFLLLPRSIYGGLFSMDDTVEDIAAQFQQRLFEMQTQFSLIYDSLPDDVFDVGLRLLDEATLNANTLLDQVLQFLNGAVGDAKSFSENLFRDVVSQLDEITEDIATRVETFSNSTLSLASFYASHFVDLLQSALVQVSEIREEMLGQMLAISDQLECTALVTLLEARLVVSPLQGVLRDALSITSFSPTPVFNDSRCPTYSATHSLHGSYFESYLELRCQRLGLVDMHTPLSEVLAQLSLLHRETRAYRCLTRETSEIWGYFDQEMKEIDHWIQTLKKYGVSLNFDPPSKQVAQVSEEKAPVSQLSELVSKTILTEDFVLDFLEDSRDLFPLVADVMVTTSDLFHTLRNLTHPPASILLKIVELAPQFLDVLADNATSFVERISELTDVSNILLADIVDELIGSDGLFKEVRSRIFPSFSELFADGTSLFLHLDTILENGTGVLLDAEDLIAEIGGIVQKSYDRVLKDDGSILNQVADLLEESSMYLQDLGPFASELVKNITDLVTQVQDGGTLLVESVVASFSDVINSSSVFLEELGSIPFEISSVLDNVNDLTTPLSSLIHDSKTVLPPLFSIASSVMDLLVKMDQLLKNTSLIPNEIDSLLFKAIAMIDSLDGELVEIFEDLRDSELPRRVAELLSFSMKTVTNLTDELNRDLFHVVNLVTAVIENGEDQIHLVTNKIVEVLDLLDLRVANRFIDSVQTVLDWIPNALSHFDGRNVTLDDVAYHFVLLGEIVTGFHRFVSMNDYGGDADGLRGDLSFFSLQDSLQSLHQFLLNISTLLTMLLVSLLVGIGLLLVAIIFLICLVCFRKKKKKVMKGVKSMRRVGEEFVEIDGLWYCGFGGCPQTFDRVELLQDHAQRSHDIELELL